MAYRLDYTAARVAAQQQAAMGTVQTTLNGEAGPVDILGRSSVKVAGHGTVQTGVFSFSDQSGDKQNDPREYLLFLPDGFQGQKLPVLLVYPGNTQTDSIFLDSTQWWQVAEREGVAAAVASTSGISLNEGVTNQPIPTYLQSGQSDLNGKGMSLLPDLFGSEDLQAWAQYLFKANGLNTTVKEYTNEQFLDSRYKVYTWENKDGIPVVQWGQTMLRPHNCYPGEMQHLWEFLKHYSAEQTADGTVTRYYSASAFKQTDAVLLK